MHGMRARANIGVPVGVERIGRSRARFRAASVTITHPSIGVSRLDVDVRVYESRVRGSEGTCTPSSAGKNRVCCFDTTDPGRGLGGIPTLPSPGKSRVCRRLHYEPEIKGNVESARIRVGRVDIIWGRGTRTLTRARFKVSPGLPARSPVRRPGFEPGGPRV